MEIVMTSRDDISLLAVQRVAYEEGGIESVTVGSKVWGIYAVAY